MSRTKSSWSTSQTDELEDGELELAALERRRSRNGSQPAIGADRGNDQQPRPSQRRCRTRNESSRSEPSPRRASRRRASSSISSSKTRTRYRLARSASMNSMTRRSISATSLFDETRQSTRSARVPSRHGVSMSTSMTTTWRRSWRTSPRHRRLCRRLAACAAPRRLRRHRRAAARSAPAPVAAAPTRFTAVPTDVDSEILQIFDEEVAEVMDSVDQWLPQWAAELGSEEALGEIRRAFHTLKGSGRIVGADVIGELAWSIENMLNRVIDGTVEANPQMPALTREARIAVPDLYKAFEKGRAGIRQPRLEHHRKGRRSRVRRTARGTRERSTQRSRSGASPARRPRRTRPSSTHWGGPMTRCSRCSSRRRQAISTYWSRASRMPTRSAPMR